MPPNIRHRARPVEAVCRWIVVAALGLITTGCASIKPPKGVQPRVLTMQTTAYCSCRKCCNWKRNWYFRPVVASGPNKGKPKDVGRTASGSYAHDGTIAADTRLFPFGTVMYIPGYGYGRVEDRGGAIKGYHIDLWFDDHDDALAWGSRKQKVKVWLR